MPDRPPAIAVALREWQAVTDDLVAIARGFDPARLDGASGCGSWTNRQLLAHMATGYGVRIAALRAAVEGAPGPEIDAGEANAANMARLGWAPLHEIAAAMMQVRGRVLVLLGQLGPEHLAVRTALAGGSELGQALSSLNAHDLEHAAELRG